MSAAKPEVQEIKFRDDLVELSEKLKSVIVADASTGTLTIPADAFFANAPEGVNEDSYKAVRGYTDLFSNAATKAGSEVAVGILKKQKDLQQVQLTGQISKKDTYEGVFKRTGTSRDFKTGDVSEYKGQIGVGRVNIVSTRSKAEYTSIKQNMRNLAEAAGI